MTLKEKKEKLFKKLTRYVETGYTVSVSPLDVLNPHYFNATLETFKNKYRGDGATPASALNNAFLAYEKNLIG